MIPSHSDVDRILKTSYRVCDTDNIVWVVGHARSDKCLRFLAAEKSLLNLWQADMSLHCDSTLWVWSSAWPNGGKVCLFFLAGLKSLS